MRFEKVPGSLIEPLGTSWAAFSPLSRRTSLLTDLAAATLEVLDEGPLTFGDVVQRLAGDSEQPGDNIEPMLLPAWDALISEGLIREWREGPVS